MDAFTYAYKYSEYIINRIFLRKKKIRFSEFFLTDHIDELKFLCIVVVGRTLND